MFTNCLLCDRPSAPVICRSCACETTALIHSRHEWNRKIPGTNVPLISFASYQGKVRRLIQIAKSNRLEKSSLVNPWLDLASQRLGEFLEELKPHLVVPVPEPRFGLDARRQLGKDLAYLLASRLRIPSDHNLLKHRNLWHQLFGKSQKERNRWQRLAFAPAYHLATGRAPRVGTKIILVDDVCTTGGSLRAAIKPFADAGLEILAAVSIADTPYHH